MKDLLFKFGIWGFLFVKCFCNFRHQFKEKVIYGNDVIISHALKSHVILVI